MRQLQQAFRIYTRQPAFSLAAVLTLALGIGANVAIFSFVNALLLRPLPFAEPDRLLRIESVKEYAGSEESGRLMPREWEEFDRERSLFEGVAAWYGSQYNLAEGGPPQSVVACMTTGNLFRVLGIPLAAGASWPDDYWRARHNEVVISYEFWQRRYGADPAIVGRNITMDASPYRVTGVTRPGFDFPLHSGVYRAANFTNAQNKDVRSLFVVGRLRPGVTPAQAQAGIDAVGARLQSLYPDANRGLRFRARTLRDAYVGEVRPYLLLGLGLAFAVLLIACGNVVNLLLSRGVVRRKELAVRVALGANRGHLIRELLAESLMLTLPGGAAGLGLAFVFVHVLRDLLRADLPVWMRIEVDASVLLFTLLVSIGIGLAAGLLPALAASRPQIDAAFTDSSRGSSAGRVQLRSRNLLVIGELALAVALVSAASLLTQSFWRLQAVDTGFTAANALTFRVDPPYTRYGKVEQTDLFYRRAIDGLLQLPGVEGVAVNNNLPMTPYENYGKPSIEAEGQIMDEQRRNPLVNPQVVSPGYFDLLKIPLLRGRLIANADRAGGLAVTVLSRPLAERLFGGQDAIGRRVRFKGLLGSTEASAEGWFQVIGIVEGVRSESLFARPTLDVYFSSQQLFAGDTYFIVRTTQDPGPFSLAAARAIQAIDPEQSIFDIRPLQTRIEDTVWQRLVAGRLSVLFGALALLLAAIGAYSVLSYAVAQRTREMGIRQALGATPGEVRWFVMRQGMATALSGIALGLGLSVLLSWLLGGLLYGASGFDFLTYLFVVGITTSVSVLACYLPARRACRVDPAVVLRDS